jgi:hypothetical protein
MRIEDDLRFAELLISKEAGKTPFFTDCERQIFKGACEAFYKMGLTSWTDEELLRKIEELKATLQSDDEKQDDDESAEQ